MRFRVWFTEKKRASKVYSIAVNGREESLALQDGVLALKVSSGSTLVRITVNDPPFRQPVQSTYYGNPAVDCAGSARTLTLEIGPAGEGLFVWR